MNATLAYAVGTVLAALVMLSALRRILTLTHESPPTLGDTLQAIQTRLDDLETRELERNAEHMAMCDRLDRLYKRLSARISRQNPPEPTNGEAVSPYDFRESVRSQRSRNGI